MSASPASGAAGESTMASTRAPRSRAAQALMDFYNRKGVFSNAGDTLADLRAALEARYRDVRIEMKGAVAVFEARAA